MKRALRTGNRGDRTDGLERHFLKMFTKKGDQDKVPTVCDAAERHFEVFDSI